MNQNDRNNLEFLLNASEDVLRNWYDTVGEDDHVYAQELLHAYMAEIDELRQAAKIEAELVTHDYAESKEVIQRLMLNA